MARKYLFLLDRNKKECDLKLKFEVASSKKSYIIICSKKKNMLVIDSIAIASSLQGNFSYTSLGLYQSLIVKIHFFIFTNGMDLFKKIIVQIRDNHRNESKTFLWCPWL